VKFAPVNEWIEYCEWCARRGGHRRGLPARLSSLLQARTQQVTYRAVARALGWPRRLATEETLAAAAAYLRPELEGEAVLTLGAPLAEWRRGHIDATLSVGPMECMPTKVAEAQLVHAAEREGLPSLTLSVNGDPVDPVILDNFAYEVHSRFRRARAAAGGRGGRGAC
jgi:predicted nucleotide-binding protein (sugar kinase/HSP70/actin superfamily)